MPAKFLPAHDQILRDIYPMFGSRGVINILPQFKPKEVASRAYAIGVKIDYCVQKTVYRKTFDGKPNRPDSYDIYSSAAERLAYARPWARCKERGRKPN